ncbi:hypothetical protein BAZMOX_196314_2 [methanotrophic endosymbiont of Bathymodiolus azoricus (Menez Gwen)]|nr:hypothetical protein BAZMOX_196314_2 [methanotrophic endosymbiont of Bathymodiolus azoricus (Menez Gwen)]
MKIDNIDVEAAVKNTQQLFEIERDISPALKSALEMMVLSQA